MMRLHHGQRISVFNRRKQENKWFKRSNKSNQLISSSLKNLVFYCSFQFNIKKTRHVFNVGRYLTYKISTFKYLTCVSESIKPVTIQEIKRWTTKNRSNAMMQCWMVHYSSIYIFRFPHRCFELRAFRVCHVKWFQEREREQKEGRSLVAKGDDKKPTEQVKEKAWENPFNFLDWHPSMRLPIGFHSNSGFIKYCLEQW